MRDAELGLLAVPAGDRPMWLPGESLLHISPEALVLSALKPAEAGDGLILRVLNPTDDAMSLDLGGAFSRVVESRRLDESHDARTGMVVPPHGLRTWLVRRR
jgi:alpha-mannosidase